MNPLLQLLISKATTPALPQSAIQPTVDSLTEPHLDQSPTMARIKGFGAGALEGLRNQTSPLNLAGLATLGLGGGAAEAAPAVEEAIPAATKGASEMLPAGSDLMETLLNSGRSAAAKPDYTELVRQATGNTTKNPYQIMRDAGAFGNPAQRVNTGFPMPEDNAWSALKELATRKE